jgi:DNA polymerase-4
MTLPGSTNDTGEIYRSAVAILDGIHLRKSVRLFGITLSSLGKDGSQMSLFQDPEQDKRSAMAKAMDAVNDKFGECSITFASTIGKEEDHNVISPAWRPSGVRKSDV